MFQLDPVVQAALVALLAAGLKWLAAYLNIPLSEELINTLAVAIVAWLLAKFGLGVVRGFVKNTRAAKFFAKED